MFFLIYDLTSLHVLSLSKGNKQISFPAPTYTGKSMTLTCGPPDISIGEISGAIWKFNGHIIKDPRIDTTFSTTESKIIITNVILADSGK